MLEGKFKKFYEQEQKEEYFKELMKFVKKEEKEKEKEIYPPKDKRFFALEKTPLEKTKVVILGQDPYHGEGQAMGLSFSVPEGFKIPPSLRNIYKELYSDIGQEIPDVGDLTKWTEEGVLLLNAVLTVEKSNAGAHAKKGWETFTDKVIELVSNENENVVFVLWGKYAEKKLDLIDQSKHKVIISAHPSPFSAHRGFFDSKCFSKTNEYLKSNNIKEIDWKIK
jgi:uracil-DNA glycosylase